MDPDELWRMLGPGHNVPWERVVAICEEFNRAARRIAIDAIEKHEAERHAHKLYIELGEEWRRPSAN